MQKYLLRRLLQIIPVFLGITFVSFLIVRSAPGDPLTLLFPPEVLTRIDRDVLSERLGLNEPLPVQYVVMMSQFFSGELVSFQERRPTLEVIGLRLTPTILFATSALLGALAIGMPIGIYSATRPYSLFDNIGTIGALAGVSLPQFWLALLFIFIFSETLRILPASGLRPVGSSEYNLSEMFPHLIMPTLVLIIGLLPAIVRYTRSSMLEALAQDYIRTARSKGLRERTVIGGHGLRNALIPVVTLIGAVIPALLGGAVLVEQIFGLPGVGRLAVQAAQSRDIPMILSLNMFAAFLVLTSNLITDITYTYLDPRVRFQ